MDLKPGDFVKFLNEVGGGKVTKIIDKYTVLVMIEDGFEIPYLKRELIKIDQEQKDEYTQAVKEPKEYSNKNKSLEQEIYNAEEIIEKDNEEINIYLGIIPENQNEPAEGYYDIYLINDSNWFLLYLISLKKKNYNSLPGILQPNMMELIHSIKFDELKNIQEISIQFLMYKKKPHQLHQPVIKSIKIRPEKFINISSFDNNDFFETKAKLFTILEEDPFKEAVKKLTSEQIQGIIKQKEKKQHKRQYKSGYVPDVVEIDLHINNLLSDTRGLSPKDMLEYQMEVFEKELKAAIKNPHVKKIIFIHGKGNGRLRQEIRNYLKKHGIKYQDASIEKYGFGATMAYVSPKI